MAEHAGREAVEVYGSPAMLAEAEASARAAGFATRRTGTSISVLGIEDADGRAPEGGDGGPVVTGTSAALGWWLTGRGTGEGLTSDSNDLPEVETW